MASINVPAVATGAFLGVLALMAAISCIPPITRFLGDLFCCPWRIPFTKKKRRNADEELGKDELPYVVEPRPNTPVDGEGYHSMSEAYMSAVDIVDPELAKEERRRSAERRSAEYRRSHGLSPDVYHHANDSAYFGREPSPSSADYHHEPRYGTHLDVSPPLPHVPAHGGNWRTASRERLHTYAPEQTHEYAAQHAQNDMSDPYQSDGYSTDQYSSPHYGAGGVQRPLPSHTYSPIEAGRAAAAAGYFPNQAYDQRDYEGHYPSTERLVGPRQHYPNA